MPPSIQPPPKQEEMDLAAVTDQIMQSLRGLPKMALQEPEVDIFHSICPVSGMSSPPLSGELEWVLNIHYKVKKINKIYSLHSV